ncbi:hypothetical protein HXX76_014146 [Chlamydomonas incerta]|uniref:SF3 helicase domain-containing protein n=1 Tax=Chlamydomonas incerta TaxID=51695 RepID=A0A835SCY7_CHLIN|nr:hypothetical protein HXX76_014146 [Chlamydomonas incerta]|eukprot:KAG2424988.1 hypothetical protein HXX76_014146 [Chlamydomonas incerta]
MSFWLSRSQAEVVHRCGGIFDEEILEGVGAAGMLIRLPFNCTAPNLKRVLLFLERGECDLDLFNGAYKNEIQFLGVESAFDEGCGFPSSCWKFIFALAKCPALLQQHLSDRINRRLVWNDWAAASAAQVPQFDTASLAATPALRGDCVEGSALLRPKTKLLEPTWDHLHQRLARLPAGIPWAAGLHPGAPGMVLAGGALESLLQGREPNDFDLFVVMPGGRQPGKEEDCQRARSLILDTIHAIRAHHSSESVYVSRNKPHVVDLVTFYDAQRPVVRYQIITRVYASAAQVVAGFDIDSCRLAYDGRSLRAHATAFRAWRNGWNLFNATTLSNTALHRYHKKLTAGMGILIPGVEQEYLDRAHTGMGAANPASVEICLRHTNIMRLAPTVDGLLLFARAMEIPEIRRRTKPVADYGGGSEVPNARFYCPCTTLNISDQETLAMPAGPHLADLCTHKYVVPEWQKLYWPMYAPELPDGHFRVNLSFCILRDCTGCFTGAFNPRDCDMYTRDRRLQGLASTSTSAGSSGSSGSGSGNATVLFSRFCHTCRVEKGKPFTHTSFRPAAAYHVHGDDVDEFFRTYCLAMEAGMPLHMTEKHMEVGPVVLDFDFRFPADCVTRSYTREHVQQILTVYMTAAEQYLDLKHICTDEGEIQQQWPALPPGARQPKIYVLEKPEPRKEGEKVKDGIHIVIPNVVTPIITQRYLRDRVLPLLADVLEDIGTTNTAADCFDAAVIDKNNWTMYGSSKPDHPPYEVTQVYEWTASGELEPSDLEEPRLCVSILSIRNKSTLETPMCDDMDRRAEIERYAAARARRPNNAQTPQQSGQQGQAGMLNAGSSAGSEGVVRNQVADNELQLVQKFVDALDPVRAQSYESWIRVGWCLRNIDYRLLDVWISFSHKAPGYDNAATDANCTKLWNEMKVSSEGLRAATLHMWAKEDNPELYKKIVSADIFSLVNIAQSGTHYDVARVVKCMYGNQFVCASPKHKLWYEFKGHHWVQCEEGVDLSWRMSEEVFKEFSNVAAIFNQRVSLSNDELEQKKNLDIAGKLIGVAKKLRDTNFKRNVLTECTGLMHVPDFESKLDSNTMLLGFENGVYDLERHEFREGMPEDYISFSTGINYKPYDPDSPNVEQLKKYFAQVLPIEAVREHVLLHLASCLDGNIRENRFYIWTGCGSNGKSLTISLVERTLGKYACKLPVAFVTTNRNASNSASSEVVRTKGRRFVVMQEPSENERFNIGIIKEHTGGDVIQARELYKPPIEFKPQFKLVLTANHLPEVRADDDGTWRRIRVVEFISKFVASPNPNNPYEFPIDMELSNSMAQWCEDFMGLLLEYYKHYRVAGNPEPSEIMACTREYQRNNDILSEFLESCTEAHENAFVTSVEIYAMFRDWMDESNPDMRVPREKEFTKMLTKAWGMPSANPKGWRGYKVSLPSRHVDNLVLLLSAPHLERRAAMKERLEQCGIPYDVIDGVFLKTQKSAKRVCKEVDVQPRETEEALGDTGFRLAFLRLMKHIVDNHIQYALYIEDDVVPNREGIAEFCRGTAAFLDRADYLFLQPTVTFGTQCQLITLKGATVLLEARERLMQSAFLPDIVIWQREVPNLHMESCVMMGLPWLFSHEAQFNLESQSLRLQQNPQDIVKSMEGKPSVGQNGALINPAQHKRTEQIMAALYVPRGAVTLQLGGGTGLVACVINKKSGTSHLVVEPDTSYTNALLDNMISQCCAYRVSSDKVIQVAELQRVHDLHFDCLVADTLDSFAPGYLFDFMNSNHWLLKQLDTVIFKRASSRDGEGDRVDALLLQHGMACIEPGFITVYKRLGTVKSAEVSWGQVGYGGRLGFTTVEGATEVDRDVQNNAALVISAHAPSRVTIQVPTTSIVTAYLNSTAREIRGRCIQFSADGDFVGELWRPRQVSPAVILEQGEHVLELATNTLAYAHTCIIVKACP